MQSTLYTNTIKAPINAVKNLGDYLPNLSLPSSNIKIAITGLRRAGKTVFITSLVDQLLYKSKLVSVTSKKKPFKASIKFPNSKTKRFDYYTYIDLLKNKHTWPKGTDEISNIVLEFEGQRSFKWMGKNKFSIELIDYPGEWLLDLTLLEMSFEQWSEKTINWLTQIDDPLVLHYLQTINDLDTVEDKEIWVKAHEEYKELLYHLKKNHYSQLTPGRFTMPSDLAKDPILHFAPIKATNEKLHKFFKSNYALYVKNVVKDIQLENFKGFDRQVVLVDVIEALQNGYTCYKDMKLGLQSMFHFYDHKNKNLISQWFSPSIKKVLFVATKADQVSASQHANFSLLLDDMILNLKNDMDIDYINTDTQLVASLKSTETIRREYEGTIRSFIRGVLSENGEKVDLDPGEVPSEFPSKGEWNTEEYLYKNFEPPHNSYRDNEPLEHINMDKVVTKLIGDLL